MLITGVTGFVGSELAGWLLDEGVPFRTGSRHPLETKEMLDSHLADSVYFDFEKDSTYEKTFSGVKRWFLTRPSNIGDVEPIVNAMKAAKECGVERLVFLSVLGAERMGFLPHRRIEKAIMELGFNYTILRASHLMQDFLKYQILPMKEDHEINAPAGFAKISFVDSRDVAEIAYLALRNSLTAKDVYKVTGKQALTMKEAAQLFSEELNTVITYSNPTKHQFLEYCYHRGYSSSLAKQLANIYTSAKNGFFKTTSLDTEKLLQRQPRGMQEFIQNYKPIFLDN
ncbi:NmrA family NAD(P)-binding protein [Halobacillus sp. Marseille-Q1614]|uniref:NmrA family NAD(P)-binding protein n=1 Tax=Halobacillus sp. Marseille-Q1614 TaxID=2709134 RepID=UPI00156FA625|nr:NmrA family NAD(P)-binding protein [Halobacillus sp. Marseille-Q1614]